MSDLKVPVIKKKKVMKIIFYFWCTPVATDNKDLWMGKILQDIFQWSIQMTKMTQNSVIEVENKANKMRGLWTINIWMVMSDKMC